MPLLGVATNTRRLVGPLRFSRSGSPSPAFARCPAPRLLVGRKNLNAGEGGEFSVLTISSVSFGFRPAVYIIGRPQPA